MSTVIKSYKDLDVWKLSRSFIRDIYKLTARFPEDERYGLISQMRRAAVSIASNIAEGHARPGRKDFANFISIAIGSAAEIETQLIVSLDLGFVQQDVADLFLSKIDRIQKMLHKLYQMLGKQK